MNERNKNTAPARTRTDDAPGIPLPSKLSELLTVAIADATAVAANPFYYPVSALWHRPGYRSGEGPALAYDGQPAGSMGAVQCAACLAGSVIAQRAGVEPNQDRLPTQFDDQTHRRLGAIDAMRRGSWSDATGMTGAPELDPETLLLLENRPVHPSYLGHQELKRTLEELRYCATVLQDHGH